MKILVFDPKNSLEKIILPNFNIELLAKQELPHGNQTKILSPINLGNQNASVYLEHYLKPAQTQLELPEKQNSSYQAIEYFNQKNLGNLFEIAVFIGNLAIYENGNKITRPLLAYERKKEHQIKNLDFGTQIINQWSRKFEQTKPDKFAHFRYEI